MSAATGTGIVIEPLIHREEPRIALRFPYDLAMIRKVRALPQARWSATHKCWHLPDTPTSTGHQTTDTRYQTTDIHVTTKSLESIQSPLDQFPLGSDRWKKRNGDTCLQGLTAGKLKCSGYKEVIGHCKTTRIKRNKWQRRHFGML